MVTRVSLQDLNLISKSKSKEQIKGFIFAFSSFASRIAIWIEATVVHVPNLCEGVRRVDPLIDKLRKGNVVNFDTVEERVLLDSVVIASGRVKRVDTRTLETLSKI